MRVVIKTIYSLIVRFLSYIVPKKKNYILFLPHINCRNDKYDIINYQSDNVLCLLNYMFLSGNYNNYSFAVRIYDSSRVSDYLEYVNNLGFKGKVHFIPYGKTLRLLSFFVRAYTIFTDNYYEPTLYKIKRQRCICLGYYAAPFKDDYFKVLEMSGFRRIVDRIVKNSAYDYHVSTSDYASRGISLDSQIEYFKFVTLGFPRNDEMLKNSDSFKKKVYDKLGFTPKFIIIYAPTHRDYERPENGQSEEQRSIFGTEKTTDLQDMQRTLEDLDAIIIAKIHPRQERSVIKSSLTERMFFLSDFSLIGANLQLFLSISDLLISDYSSVFYDYLLLNKPIIHYCYDYEQNVKARGFFIDPIEPFFAGDVIYKLKELPGVLKENIVNPKKNEDKRNKVRSLVFKYNDGNACKRIESCFFGNTDR